MGKKKKHKKSKYETIIKGIILARTILDLLDKVFELVQKYQ